MMHYTVPYLLAPQHKITVNIIGVGGTGSQVLTALARIHTGLLALGHPGLHVRAWDPDSVSHANIGRQMFSPADIGVNKAIIAITRINRFFGLNWEAKPEAFKVSPRKGNVVFYNTANLTITCVDTAKTRVDISKIIRFEHDNMVKNTEWHYRQLYWLDFGNGQKTGQVVLGTVGHKEYKVARLKTVAEMFDLRKIKEVDQGPSCSLAEAIEKQDLFINSTLANLGCNLLWKLFTDGKIDYRGLYLNLETMQVRGIAI